MDDITLMREISRLQNQIDALRTIEVGGVWTEWTPTIVGWSATTTFICQYSKIGKFVAVMYQIIGTSDTTTMYLDLPFTADTSPAIGVFAYGVDNGTAMSNAAFVVTDTADRVRVYKNPDGTGWTASGSKRIITQFFYKAA